MYGTCIFFPTGKELNGNSFLPLLQHHQIHDYMTMTNKVSVCPLGKMMSAVAFACANLLMLKEV